MERLIFIFVDGCGVGAADAGNPFFLADSRNLPFWRGAMALADGTPVKAIDATLGIAGAPQSASGQTALFCGATAAELAHRHRNGYPDRALRQVILKKNLLSRLAAKGVAARFLNAYPAHEELFTSRHVRILPDGRLWFSAAFPERFKRMVSVTSCMLLASGQKPFGAGDIRAGKALYQDYSNRSLIEKGLSLPEFSPDQAARDHFQGAARRFDFILYEYFQTDLYAHRRPLEECVALVRDLDAIGREAPVPPRRQERHPGPDQRPRQPGGFPPARPQPQPGAAARLGQARRPPARKGRRPFRRRPGDPGPVLRRAHG